MKSNKTIILFLLIAIALMAVGYIFIIEKLISINNENNNNKDIWNVKIISIVKNTSLSTTGVKENITPYYSGTSASFDVSLLNPNEKIVYDIVIKNSGTLDATLKNIVGPKEITNNIPVGISYEIDMLDSANGKVTKNNKDLKSNKNSYYRLVIEWNPLYQNIKNPKKNGTIYFNYEQK